VLLLLVLDLYLKAVATGVEHTVAKVKVVVVLIQSIHLLPHPQPDHHRQDVPTIHQDQIDDTKDDDEDDTKVLRLRPNQDLRHHVIKMITKKNPIINHVVRPFLRDVLHILQIVR